MLKNLQSNGDFSDVTFICSDKTEIPAHKNILAAASDFFRTYFQGPWGENHPDGRWETTNSPEIMTMVLSFIYTGKLPSPAQVDSNVSDLLRVSQEYNLPGLLQVVEDSCIRHLSVDNVKSLLQLAHLHESHALEKACFDFVRQHAADVLTKPEIMAMATENPALWEKLSSAISSDNKKRKRN